MEHSCLAHGCGKRQTFRPEADNEPTINTKAAFDAINSMFSSQLPGHSSDGAEAAAAGRMAPVLEEEEQPGPDGSFAIYEDTVCLRQTALSHAPMGTPLATPVVAAAASDAIGSAGLGIYEDTEFLRTARQAPAPMDTPMTGQSPMGLQLYEDTVFAQAAVAEGRAPAPLFAAEPEEDQENAALPANGNSHAARRSAAFDLENVQPVLQPVAGVRAVELGLNLAEMEAAAAEALEEDEPPAGEILANQPPCACLGAPSCPSSMRRCHPVIPVLLGSHAGTAGDDFAVFQDEAAPPPLQAAPSGSGSLGVSPLPGSMGEGMMDDDLLAETTMELAKAAISTPLDHSGELCCIIDAFDPQMQQRLLAGVQPPLVDWRGVHVCSAGETSAAQAAIAQARRTGSAPFSVGGLELIVKGCVARGAFSDIFAAIDCGAGSAMGDDDEEEDGGSEAGLALKLQTPGCPWEFYVCKALQARAREGLRVAYQDPVALLICGETTLLASRMGESGTLQDVLSAYQSSGQRAIPELLAMVYTAEMMRAVAEMHRAQVLHGDIK